MKITPIKLLGMIAFSTILMSATCSKDEDYVMTEAECDQCAYAQREYYLALKDNRCERLAPDALDERDDVKELCVTKGTERADAIWDACRYGDEPVFSCD